MTTTPNQPVTPATKTASTGTVIQKTITAPTLEQKLAAIFDEAASRMTPEELDEADYKVRKILHDSHEKHCETCAELRAEVERLKKARTSSAVERLHNLCDGFEEMDDRREAELTALRSRLERVEAAAKKENAALLERLNAVGSCPFCRGGMGHYADCLIGDARALESILSESDKEKL
jgi:hypothetical protein